MRIAVLGIGLVGQAIARDLAAEADFHVLAVDLNPANLRALADQAPVQIQVADLRQPGVIDGVVAGADLVVCAVPGFMGYQTLQDVIAAGKDVVDISFFAEDAFLLDELARERQVTAIVDCGVAPGLCNVLAGYVDSQLEELTRYTCYVGGLPRIRQWPYEYKAPFSPPDVIEEYTRPARLVEYGREVVRPALSEGELLHFPGIGTLEAFNTDGLRTLRHTLSAPFMQEKTLRYPGHAELMRVLRATGFFSQEAIEVAGSWVRPLDLTSTLLFDQWRLAPGEEDITVMQVIIEGYKHGSLWRYTYDLFDVYDAESQTTAMARTTGTTCAIAVRLLAGGSVSQPGICPPELLGRMPGIYAYFQREYGRRGIQVDEHIEALP